ncbi:MAG: hypothetical protein ACU84Q_15715 [Gammaproteobacteria bacterium]
MNWEAVGAIGELVGGLIVVASLIFVGYQLRQTSMIERAKAQRDLLLQARAWVAMPSCDEERFDAICTCLEDYDGADDWAREQFSSWAFDVLIPLESALYTRKEGFVNAGSFERFEQLVLSIVRTPSGGQWWANAYNVIGTDVGQHVKGRLDRLGETVIPWTKPLPQFER